MAYKRILTVQDISCLGQCSLTVALPILSAAGVETAILPSAVLSTHTAGFQGYTFRDLTDDMPAIAAHWQKEGLSFGAILTGYLGSARQIDTVKSMASTLLQPGGKLVVDPAMADHGKLYPAFDGAFVHAMKRLVFGADLILPNITEACLLTDTDYRETYDQAYIETLLQKLASAGAGEVVLTGVSYTPDTTGVAVWQQGRYAYYRHKRINRICHGTGDVYAAAFMGALTAGRTAFDAAAIAADYTVRCIENTEPEHWYGVRFETALSDYIADLARPR